VNLTDREILELNQLCGAVVDGTLTDAQRARLSQWLRESAAARRHYVRALGQSASLHSYAAEVHTEAPDAPTRAANVVRFPLWWAAILPAAAALVMGLIYLRTPAVDENSGAAQPSDFVGRITGVKDSQWAAGSLATGAHVRKGQKLELSAGVAEVTFDSGARVVLEGAASLHINSAWDVTLRRGTLKASVPPEAVGFRVSNAAVEVVDLGTEFTMVADAGGAEVFVLKGEVEAAPRGAGQEAILLKEGASRRFAPTGVSDVNDSARKFALFTEPLALDRLALVTRHLHWSFDEAVDGAFRAAPADATGHTFDARLQGAMSAPTTGRRGLALPFTGQNYGIAKFPGLSGNTPHTIAFWVRVPEDAPLSDAYSMVTWFANNRKLGNRHVGINWNRDRNDGPIGALRTDFGGGQAVGLTSLRDGRWHHIAVCFSPGDEDPTVPVQVKQYVDGRLESSTIIPGKTRGPAVAENAALADLVWLGARLGATGPRQQRFRGDLDELFIADRGLEPQEIVSLMNENRLPYPTLAAHR
jgi:ferric-dicitrate binding protein FerR (iron transport regulator)